MRPNSVGLVATGLLAGLVLAGLTTADAQSPTPGPTATRAPREGRSERDDRQRVDRAIHSEMTVPGKDGTFLTFAGQRGELLALTATSLTVQSADGFSRTYVITADTKVADGVAVGDQVRVHALVENGVARALRVTERTARPT